MGQNPTPQEVDAFLDSTLIGDDPVLVAALEASNAAGLPPIAVSVQQGKFLSLLVSAMQARRILELGTLGGFSTIWLARGAGHAGAGGDTGIRAQARRGRAGKLGTGRRGRPGGSGGWRSAGHVADGDGRSFRSGVHRCRQREQPRHLDWALRLTRPGSVIVVDNVIRDGQILAESEDPRVTATRQTLEVMGEHPRLDTAVLQTVGVKGWDGFAIASVR